MSNSLEKIQQHLEWSHVDSVVVSSGPVRTQHLLEGNFGYYVVQWLPLLVPGYEVGVQTQACGAERHPYLLSR